MLFALGQRQSALVQGHTGDGNCRVCFKLHPVKVANVKVSFTRKLQIEILHTGQLGLCLCVQRNTGGRIALPITSGSRGIQSGDHFSAQRAEVQFDIGIGMAAARVVAVPNGNGPGTNVPEVKSPVADPLAGLGVADDFAVIAAFPANPLVAVEILHLDSVVGGDDIRQIVLGGGNIQGGSA